MPSSKTPQEILHELEEKQPHSFKTPEYNITMSVDIDYIRSSMQSLLLHVMGDMPLKAVPLPGKSLRKVNLGYNEAISDCLAVLQSTIDSIKE